MTSEVKAALIIAGAIIITTAMWIYYWRLDQAEGFWGTRIEVDSEITVVRPW